MNTSLRSPTNMILFSILFVQSMTAAINFGNKQSTIQVADHAKLFINSPNFTIDGTLNQGEHAHITGQPIIFNNGLFAHGGTQSSLHGSYSPAENKFEMIGGSVFHFQQGTVLPAISVSSTHNRLEGEPYLSHPITFSPLAQLTLAIHNTLSQNIELNDGTLSLDNDLALADNVYINGNGIVDLNHRQLYLGAFYDAPWNTSLSWRNATALFLQGNTALDHNTVWNFTDTSRINGNGAQLDLSAGGVISIAAGEKLFLEDIILKGITSNSIVFGSATSELHLINTTLILGQNTSLTAGAIIIDGESNIVLNGNDITISQQAHLTINGTVLWLEQLSKETGMLSFIVNDTILPVYDHIGYKVNHINTAINASLLTLNNNGLIKKTSTQDSLDPDEVALLSGSTQNNVILKRNLNLAPSQAITIAKSITLDGNFSTISFSNGNQIIIPDNQTLTLKNITLNNVTNDTIWFGQNAHLNIGEHVTFQLGNHVEYASNTKGENIAPMIRILQAADGSGNIFHIQGLQKYTLSFTSPAGIKQRPLTPGNNYIELENIELKSIDATINAPGINKNPEYPALNLMGNASYDLYGKKSQETSQTRRPRSSIDFYIEGPNNHLNIMRDGIDFDGSIMFGSRSFNELKVRFKAENLSTGRVGNNKNNTINDGFPFITLSGSGIGVYSPIIEESDPIEATGIARLIFEDDNAAVEITSYGAFHIDTSAQLLFHNLQLVGDSLKQNSMNVIIGGSGSHLIGDIDTTGIRRKTKDEHLAIAQPLQQNPEPEHKKKHKKKNTSLKKDVGWLNNPFETVNAQYGHFTPLETIWEEDEETLTRALNNNTVAFFLPQQLDRPQVVNVYEEMQTAFHHTCAYQGSTIDNFVTFETSSSNEITHKPFNLILNKNNIIRCKNVDMSLNYLQGMLSASQVINVTGKHNTLQVSKNITFNNNLFIGPGAELTIEFPEQSGASVTFEKDSLLILEKNATLRFKGQGRVLFKDGATCYFKGDADSSKYRNQSAKNRSQLILTNQAILDAAPDATINFLGVGRIICDLGGLIKPSAPCSIIIGPNATYQAPTTTQNPPRYIIQKTASFYDLGDFEIFIKNNGEIRLDLVNYHAPAGSNLTQEFIHFSIYYCKFSLHCEQGGMLTIGKKTIFDINVDSQKSTKTQRVLLPGRIHDVSFAYNGILYIKEGGMLSIGKNLLSPVTDETGLDLGYQVLRKSEEIPFTWNTEQSRIGGNGLIRYIDAKEIRDISGTFSPTNALFNTYEKTITTKMLVQKMIS